jgi:exodeoxyribonuclease VIII
MIELERSNSIYQMQEKYLKVIVDLETVSTDNEAGILSIGAVVCDSYDLRELPAELTEFYEKIAFTSLEPMGFHLDKKTLEWWNSQEQLVRDEAFSGTKHISTALQEFILWIESIKAERTVQIWGNGATFDNVILRNALDRCSIKVPWTYKNDMCYRTICTTFKEAYRVAESGVPANIMEHSAIADARYQRDILEYIFSSLRLSGAEIPR